MPAWTPDTRVKHLASEESKYIIVVIVIKNKNSNNDCHHGVPYSRCTWSGLLLQPGTAAGQSEWLRRAPPGGAGPAAQCSAGGCAPRPAPPSPLRLRIRRPGRFYRLPVARACLLGLWSHLAVGWGWPECFLSGQHIPREDLRAHLPLTCLHSQEEEIKKGKADCFEKQLIALKESVQVQRFQASLPIIRTENYRHQVGRTTRKHTLSACVQVILGG